MSVLTVSSRPVSFLQPDHLRALESESVHVLREAVAESERPVLLFSGGKDSALLLRLAVKAFWPARPPFPVMHIDTGHNFPEVVEFRDTTVSDLGLDLIVVSVQDAIDQGRVAEAKGALASRNQLQIESLLTAIKEHQFDVVFGGARRDEEKSRAKERVFSFRDEFGQWDPKSQRPELWSLYNARHGVGEHMRVFPMSNWTELDVWQYISDEGIEIPSIYFSHRRMVFQRNGMLMPYSPLMAPVDGMEAFEASVRFRTVGDMTCTGALESTAETIHEVIVELSAATISERGASRADDLTGDASMEDRKIEGYF